MVSGSTIWPDTKPLSFLLWVSFTDLFNYSAPWLSPNRVKPCEIQGLLNLKQCV
jgi:hypothetical protein